MKAAVVSRFGANWEIAPREVAKPVPGPSEILLRVHAATVNRTDYGEIRHPLLQRLIARTLRRRTILGMDFSGVVESVGVGVRAFKGGDHLFGMCPSTSNGAQADYLCLPDSAWMAHIPANTRFDEAVVCEGAFYANASLSRLRLPKGSPIMIYGASGSIGSAAVQLAKYYGFHVTAVVGPPNLAMADALRADRVVDYTTAEFDGLGNNFDFVLDAVGKLTASRWRQLLTPMGVFATTDIGPKGQSLLLLLWSLFTRSGRVTIPVPKRASGQDFVDFLKERLATGQFRAVVDRSYSIDEIADAYRYVQTGQKAGIVVIDLKAS